jgi:hypothetical protein
MGDGKKLNRKYYGKTVETGDSFVCQPIYNLNDVKDKEV